MDKIYIIGHKSPDLDSVAAAISYADLKNKSEDTSRYTPAVLGEINKETKYVLEKFGFEVPEILENATGKNVVLVDHNEFSQSADGIEEAKIEEVLDHHKVNFTFSDPIVFRAFPVGASCSIVAEEFSRLSVLLEANMAGLMLSAILVDTVITKSPTCTERDIKIIEELSEKAGVSDWKEFGMEVFKIRASVSELSAEEILMSDFKDFEFSQGKFGIGQVETVDLSDFDSGKEEILKIMDQKRQDEDYHSILLYLTDIINVGSEVLVVTSDQGKMEEALGVKLDGSRIYQDGIISRKKQVTPTIDKYFNK